MRLLYDDVVTRRYNKKGAKDRRVVEEELANMSPAKFPMTTRQLGELLGVSRMTVLRAGRGGYANYSGQGPRKPPYEKFVCYCIADIILGSCEEADQWDEEHPPDPSTLCEGCSAKMEDEWRWCPSCGLAREEMSSLIDISWQCCPYCGGQPNALEQERIHKGSLKKTERVWDHEGLNKERTV